MTVLSHPSNRYFSTTRQMMQTEYMLKHSITALDGWEGSGCWVDALKTLRNHTPWLNVYLQPEENKASLTGAVVHLQICYYFIYLIRRVRLHLVCWNIRSSESPTWPRNECQNMRKADCNHLSFFKLTSLCRPLHAVPPSNQLHNRPNRKWKRKCARDQFLSVSH